MVIIGFDQSSRVSGYVVLNGEELVASGRLSYTNTDRHKRISRLKGKVAELVQEYKPDKVYLEDLFGGKGGFKGRVTSAMTLGVICDLLFESEIPFEIVGASTWRKPFGFNKGRTGGDVKKDRAVAFVKDKYKIDVGPDEAEAICIGLYGARQESGTEESI